LKGQHVKSDVNVMRNKMVKVRNEAKHYTEICEDTFAMQSPINIREGSRFLKPIKLHKQREEVLTF